MRRGVVAWSLESILGNDTLHDEASNSVCCSGLFSERGIVSQSGGHLGTVIVFSPERPCSTWMQWFDDTSFQRMASS